MKIIEYRCDNCGNRVDDWEWPTNTSMEMSDILDNISHRPKCCGLAMTQVPWMNNVLPTCGVK